MKDMPFILPTSITMTNGNFLYVVNIVVEIKSHYRAYKVLKRFELSSPQLRQNILKSLSKAGRHWPFILGRGFYF